MMKYHIALTAAAVIGALIMLVGFIDYNGFWIDELYTLHSIRLGWREMVLERLHRGHFPAYFAVARLWLAPWPERLFETGLRCLSVMFYLLALVSFWPLARRVLSAPASLVAVSLFACNQIALRQGVEARMYTMMLLVAVWIIRSWYELQQPGASSRWRVAMPLLSVVGFMISGTTGILLGSLLIVGFFCRNECRQAFRATVISLILGLLFFVPGAVFHGETGQRLGISSSKPTVFLTHLTALMPGVQIWDDYYETDFRLIGLLCIGCAVTLMAGFVLWKNRSELPSSIKRMAAAAVLPLGLITLAYPLVELFSLSIMGPPRYFLNLMPMAALVGAWTLMQFSRRLLVHGALTVFLLFSAWTILTVNSEQFRKQVTVYLGPRYHPGDGIVVTPHEIADGVELYLPGTTVDQAVSRWIMDREELRARLEPLSNRAVVWLIWYRGNDSPLLEVAEEMWGQPESNRPAKPHGKLRIYKFNPMD